MAQVSESADQHPGATSLSARSKIAAITAALLAVPALINAVYDIYAAAMKLPRTDAERTNVQLFKKYMLKVPLAQMSVPIKTQFGIADASFNVFEEGDIYVEYGGQTQWFALPKPQPNKSVSISVIPTALAAPYLRTAPRLVKPPSMLTSQSNSLTGSTLLRMRYYNDGTFESEKVDIRSGTVLDYKSGPFKTSPFKNSKTTVPLIFQPLDLEKLQLEAKPPASAASAGK